MEQILTTFGVDWHLLLINGLNFGLLMAALWYFLYGPVTKMLEERRQKVEQGVRDAEAAERMREEVAASRMEVLAGAGKEADEVVANARAAARKKEQELVEKGEATAASLLKEAGAQAEEMKRRAIEESKQEVAKLIVLGMEQAMRKK